ncbi:hypothetical protein [Candidatus Thiothrix anitrata]|uniref:Uncharacterized protein n=1 Tax=Candidatus Thiothrix anitrata TaxID=2823902 RepID=A0ABX7X5U2_9GAMM|nr:hypothetical protein [Candidatus Thiothrix anitrata]QTR51245.1 hypothetical protein J8380_06765 [Candidatus Thiothrix anitrata]
MGGEGGEIMIFLKELMDFLKKEHIPNITTAIGIVIVFLFSIILIFSLFINGGQLNNAQIRLSEIKNISQVMKNCEVEGAGDCSDLEATLVVVNQNLESINNALKLEEIGALIGVFVTISTIVLPIFMMANMRAEKADIKSDLLKNQEDFDKKIEKLEGSYEVFRAEVETLRKERSDIFDKAGDIANSRSLARNKIMLHVYQAKASYFIDAIEIANDDDKFSLQDILETQARAHEIELNIIKLMSSDKREVEAAGRTLRELLDSADYKKPFMKHIRLAVDIITKTPDYNIYQWQQAELRKLGEWLDNPDDPPPIMS